MTRAIGFLGAALLAMTTGCMSFDGLDAPVRLETNVADWRDRVIYQVLVDRFADGDAGNNFNVDMSSQARWHGGDWAGLEGKLDYLSELGVGALWISPVYRNVETDASVDGYHGYWPQDFTTTNIHYGDLMALRSLVRSAHDRGIAVILDVVTNHVGQLFFYDINLNGNPDESVRGSGEQSEVTHINEYDPDFDPRGIQAETSLGEAGPAPVIFNHDPASNHMPPVPVVLQRPEMYNRRGRTVSFEDPDQLLHGDFPGGLKDLDTTRCEVKQAMVDVYARWVELTDVDGFRIDTIKHVDREFWRYFAQKVRQRLARQGKTNFFMFGEAFDGREELVGAYTKSELPSAETLARENECVEDGLGITGDQLDGVFHFPQYYQVIRDVFRDSLSTDRIERLWSDRTKHYGTSANELGTGLPPVKTLVNFIDNHDVPRFLFEGDAAGLRLALLFVMSQDGLPCIYYGTEQDLRGGNDPANREDMWLTGYATTGDTFRYTQALARLRAKYVALRRGDARVVWASARTGAEQDAGIFAFERSGGDAGDAYALVVMNTNREHVSAPVFGGAPMKVGVNPGTVLVDVLGSPSSPPGTKYTVSGQGTLLIELPPRTGALLVPQSEL
ncbi:MAG: alpha-amylase [Deltaproteobacteria bacterium]|nr:alpha-amylase [Deltaproteobacteria bacterium]